MKIVWKLQDAKSRFSKVVEDALTVGPQYITRRGVEAVVVVSNREYEELTSGMPSFKDFLLNCPHMDQDFEIERRKDSPRSIKL